jgi:RHS repeat-associated protein
VDTTLALSYNPSSELLDAVLKDSTNSITSYKRYLWADGHQPAEERAANGTTIERRYHHQGEQRFGGTDAGKYLYTTDHLGSIRELIDSTGTIRALYDYDPYGVRTKLSGDLDTVISFTGHPYHTASGLHLTLFRAYDAELGRWLSADPIGEAGGMNLYGYVHATPLNFYDPLGLAWESTPTQGWHYNDRSSSFGFRLEVQNGRVCPAPMGGTHTYDEARANMILRKAMADKNLWGEMRKDMARAFDNPSYRDKVHIRNLGRAMRRAGAIGVGISAVMGVNQMANETRPICDKLKAGQTLSDYEKFKFLDALDQSGIPGKGAIASEFVDHAFF